MPKYRCHKEVWALHITGISPQNADGSWDLLVSDGFLPRIITNDWYLKHSPYVGGYFVQYEDGYTSFSPQKAFEEGYSRIDGTDRG